MKYILGIDQGGSKTHAVVADEQGRLLGLGRAAGACHSMHGMAAAMAAVGEAADQALEMAGLRQKDLYAAAGGLTGIDWADEAGLVRDALARTLSLPSERVEAVNDCIIALRAATSKAEGCILCAGTGLNCAVRDSRGSTYAFGFYIPDRDQGGMALGWRALQAVYDAESGMGEKTSLTMSVLEIAGAAGVDELLRRQVTGRIPSSLPMGLPVVVEKAALAGDRVAIALLDAFGRDVARYAVTALKRFGLTDRPVEVVLSGSVFKCRAPALTNAVRQTILSAAPRAVIVQSVLEPVVGAVMLALDRLTDTSAEELQSQIRRDAQRFHLVRNDNQEGADDSPRPTMNIAGRAAAEKPRTREKT